MSRNISSAVTSISQLSTVRYRLLCEIYSGTGTVYACTGANFVLFNGNTYSPVGNLGGVDPIQEESDVFPRSVKIWFAAVNTQAIADVLAERMFRRPVVLLRTFLTDSYTCVSTPETVFRGRINTCEMRLKDPDRGDYFEIEVESKLNRVSRSLYFNRETLANYYAQSGNTLFEFVSQIPFKKANWGGISVSANGFNPFGPDFGKDVGGVGGSSAG